MIIAIDGPAGAGKSSVALKIADKTGFLFLNSGSFYRAITWAVLQKGIDIKNSTEIIKTAAECDIKLNNSRIILNNQDIEDYLHTDQIDKWVAQLSVIIPVREIVNNIIKKIARSLDIVVEGRDMTTVVFPDADIKVFIDADVEVRAKRRFNQGISSLSFEEIVKNIEKRDRIDKKKPYGTLKISSDSLYLNSSDLTIDEVCEKVISKINKLNST